MKDKAIVAVVGIASVTAIGCVCIATGQDGAIVGTVTGIIGTIIGYVFGKQTSPSE